ncbi:MAG: hypothetical protein ACR2QJ_00860 [Geminicoccaceae bacterium]
MLTLRLPVDDRYPGRRETPGLDEAPCSFGTSAEIEAMGGLAAGPPPLCLKTLGEQLEIACRYGAMIERVAARHGFLPSVIAGFCSRRSSFGLDLSPVGVDGTRDDLPRASIVGVRATALPPDGHGFRRGLMGLDYDRHPLARGSRWRDPEQNVEAAFALIADYRTLLRRRTTLQATGLLRASFMAFECGFGRVQRTIRNGLDVDSPTEDRAYPGKGCGRDVLARAGLFQAEGWD